MNFLLNRLDNLQLAGKSYEIISPDISKEIQMDAKILGPGGTFLLHGKDAMYLVQNCGLKEEIGAKMYDALMRKPMMAFVQPTQEDELEAAKEQLDAKYGSQALKLNSLAMAFSIACWFIKDSCISPAYAYWFNLINGYDAQYFRDAAVSMSDGSIIEISLTDQEMMEAIKRMYQVFQYLLPDEVKSEPANMTYSGGTIVWEVEKAIGTEGNSFARALILLQQARKTGVLASRIDKYCAVLECLYAIKEAHKKHISHITAAYIGRDEAERAAIVANIRDAYGVRSDSSHGENLSYFKDNDSERLKELARTVDDYVRRVFRKVIEEPALNYDTSSEQKAAVRAHFKAIMLTVYPA